MGPRAAMLTGSVSSRRVLPLDRLHGRGTAAAADDIDWDTPIDRSRRFFCDTLTPLYYTTSYALLAPEHRLRYNQLTGILSNELILRLETQFVDRALAAVTRDACVDPDLLDTVRQFRDDEIRHAESWRRLNQLSEPEWYRADRPRLVRVPPVLDRLASVIVRYPAACPVVFWMQLAQEEHSIEISRRCLRLPADVLEPRYAAVYGAHLRDEVRHVHVDCHLIERFHAGQSPAGRRITAAVFRWLLVNCFLKPVRSTVRVLDVLTSEYQELRPLLPRMIRELRSLAADEAYQQMMYSRQTTPLTFQLFDAFPEFHAMSRVLLAYTPPALRRAP